VEKASKIIQSNHPTINPTPPCPLNHVSKCQVYVVLFPERGGKKGSVGSYGADFLTFSPLYY